ncbi:MAG: protein-L-isoaspartate(D-aspartate) O-methyltransferase [Candidatus Pacearchaeota archaeon]
MNKEQLINKLKAMGFKKKILDAFSSVKREYFIPEELKSKAYEDTALPIGEGQTISQPYTIALMLSELSLRKGQKVLEVGSGSGYVLALISKIVGKKGKVFGMEIINELAKKSKENLEDYKNIQVFNKSGWKGLPDDAPFDRILMSAAVREIPQNLLNQLKDKGILIAPKGPRFEQSIVIIKRDGDEFKTISEIPGFIFVPFI